MIVDNDMEPDTQQRCDEFRGALKAVAELVAAQQPGLGVPSEDLAPLLELLSRIAEEVVPQEFRHPHGTRSND